MQPAKDEVVEETKKIIIQMNPPIKIFFFLCAVLQWNFSLVNRNYLYIIMEYIKTVIILFFYFPGQLSYAQFPCGTQVSRQQLEQLDELDKSILKVPIIEDSFSVPVKLHIIRKTDGTGGLSLQKLQKELDSVNYFYKNAKIRFEQCGEINYINNSAYRTLEMPEEEDGLVRSTESPRAINIYFADTVTLDGTRVCGYSFLPMGPNTVFIDNS